MDVAVTAMFGVSDQFGRILLMPGLLHPPASLIRPQVNTRVTALRPDGLAWEEHAADTPRFPGPARRLLIEGQRTNSCTHPVAIGAAPWTTQLGSGQTLTVTGGRPGSPANTSDATRLNSTGDTTRLGSWTTTPGAVHTVSVFARRSPEAAANQAFRLTGTAPLSVSADFTATASWQRFSWQYTPTAGSTPIGVTRPASNAAYDIEVWGFQVEVGGFASTLILPPVASPGASTRAPDSFSVPLSSLGIGGNGACTVLWSGMIPQAAPASMQQSIAQIDQGWDSDRYQLRMALGSSTIEIIRANAGVGQIVAVGGTTPGTPFRAGFTVDGAGRMAASVNGGAIAVATGGPTSGLVTFRLGARAGADQNMFGETAHLRVLPFALADSALQGAIAALPA